MRKQKGRNFNIISKTLENGEEGELYLESAVSTSDSTSRKGERKRHRRWRGDDVSLFLFIEVILFVFLANRVDPRDQVYHRHLLLSLKTTPFLSFAGSSLYFPRENPVSFSFCFWSFEVEERETNEDEDNESQNKNGRGKPMFPLDYCQLEHNRVLRLIKWAELQKIPSPSPMDHGDKQSRKVKVPSFTYIYDLS